MTTKTLTPEQAKAQLEELQRQAAAIAKICPEAVKVGGNQQRIIKQTDKGGFYVRDPKLKAWSEKKGKVYVAGVNMPMSVAKALFTDDELLADIREFVESVVEGEETTQSSEKSE